VALPRSVHHGIMEVMVEEQQPQAMDLIPLMAICHLGAVGAQAHHQGQDLGLAQALHQAHLQEELHQEVESNLITVEELQ
jgi:demethoxyubiquinone hydroxylase (CLK1/Coq7/Cat5 family)